MNKTQRMMMVGLLAGLVAMSGCVEQEASMLLRGNIPLLGEATMDNMTGETTVMCTTQDPNGNELELLTLGEINLEKLKTEGQSRGNSSRQNSFLFGGAIVNQLRDNSRRSGGTERLNTNDILISRAEITYKINDNENDPNFTRPFSAIIDSDQGFLSVGIPLISGRAEVDELTNAIRAIGGGGAVQDDSIVTIPVSIQVFGKTIDGTVVESNIFDYPISFCVNCAEELQVTPYCFVR